MGQTNEESAQIVSQLLHEKEDPAMDALAAWPSGRTLHISAATRSASDSLIIRNPSGTIELRLEFDSQGPRLIVPDGKLRVEAETLAFQAETMSFDVQSHVNWQVDGEFNVRSKATNLISSEDVAVNGRFIKLNCDQVPTESSAQLAAPNENQDS